MTLEKASWVAAIVGTIIAILSGIVSYLKPPAPSIPEHASSQTQSVVVQINNSTGAQSNPSVYEPRSQETFQGHPAAKSSRKSSPDKTSLYPEVISATLLKDCLRQNYDGTFVNHCGFTIGVTWCYSLGLPEWDEQTYHRELANWTFLYNTCSYGHYYESPAIPPGGLFESPTNGMPRGPDPAMNATAGVAFVRAVKLP